METYIDDAGGVRPSLVADFYSTIIWHKRKLVNIYFHNCHDGLPSFNANASWGY